ncbi:hypothetical protein MHH81_03635 [Psychrobacillus sp. FSL H8-0484]|uniref:hypothetical protein n=1 Tax=Psychrobacillus sp. FSL H8-0484 TaxID=2921390 RepID=UPI0030FB0550
MTHAKTLNLSLDDYNVLELEYKMAVHEAVYNAGQDYVNIEDIKRTFEVSVVTQKKLQTAMIAINAGIATTQDYSTAGITNVTSENLAEVNAAVATKKTTKGSDLNKQEIQTEVDVVVLKLVAIVAINAGNATVQNYVTAEITNVTSENLAEVNVAVATKKATIGLDLTKQEIQTEVDMVVLKLASIKAINTGNAIVQDYANAGITNVISENLAEVNAAVSAKKTTKGSDLTKQEIQIEVDVVVLKLAAIVAINAGNATVQNYVTAEITNVTSENLAEVNASVSAKKTTKGSDLNKQEIQTEVDVVVLKLAAIVAINAGNATVQNYVTAEITNVTSENLVEVNATVAAKKTTKGSNLTKQEIQIEVDVVVLKLAAIVAINTGNANVQDFTTAEIINVTTENLAEVNAAVITKKATKGSNLTKQEIQVEVNEVVAKLAAIAAINIGNATVQNYATAEITNVTSENLAEVNAAVLAKKTTKGSNLTKQEIQVEVNAIVVTLAAIAVINTGNATVQEYATAGLTNITSENLAEVNAAVLAKKATTGSNLTKQEIQKVIDEFIEARLTMVKDRANDLQRGYYTQESYAAVVQALELPETTNAEKITKTKELTEAIDDLKMYVTSITPIAAIQAGNSETAPENVDSLLPNTIEVVLADGTTKIVTVLSWVDEDSYDNTMSGSYTFTAELNVPTDIDASNITISVEVVVIEKSESVMSKEITSFDFTTVPGTSAKLNSKPVTDSDFTGKEKSFTILTDGQRIPVTIGWKLSTDFTKGQSMGGVVESAIQDYYYRIQGADGLMNRPIYSVGFDDTFYISSFNTGSQSSITLEGNDWSYFFDQNNSVGKDADTSKNRLFNVNDGVKTATIQLTGKFSSMEKLVSQINAQIKRDGVSAIAEKVDDTHFKITAVSPSVKVTIGGTNKDDLF